MALSSRAIIGTCVLILIHCIISNAIESDVSCLKALKQSLKDPQNLLSSWKFDNGTEGFICSFIGIECWHVDESRVLNIRLPDMGLRGEFPIGLKNCTTMTGLDLSSNNLYGTLPTNITEFVGFVTNLDLSSNNFSGQIPRSFVNCSYLNILRLDNNRFSGQIPLELGGLNRIKEFSVSNNRLMGQVPQFRNFKISKTSYAGNPGLCGDPLPACKGTKNKKNMGVIVGQIS